MVMSHGNNINTVYALQVSSAITFYFIIMQPCAMHVGALLQLNSPRTILLESIKLFSRNEAPCVVIFTRVLC